MIYLRDTSSTVIQLNNLSDKQLVYNASYWSDTIPVAHKILMSEGYDGLLYDFMTVSDNMVYAVSMIPEKYTCVSVTDRVSLPYFGPTKYTWYDGDNTIIQYVDDELNVDEEYRVLITKKLGTSVTFLYDNSIYTIKFVEPKLSYTGNCMVCFMDKYGLYQTAALQMGASSFSTDYDDSYSSFVPGITKYASIKPKQMVTVGEEGIPVELYDFYAGLNCSPGISINLSGEYYECIQSWMSGCSLTSNYFTRPTLAMEGVIEIPVSKHIDLK